MLYDVTSRDIGQELGIKIPTPKIILTKDNYFSTEARQQFLGSSNLKDYMDCEARAKAIDNGQFCSEEKKTFALGHYVHAWNEGPAAFENFNILNKDIIYGRSGKYADFQYADTAIETIKEDKFMLYFLQTGEQEKIITANLFGLPFKIMIDNLNADGPIPGTDLKGFFTDLKYIRSLHKKEWKEGSGWVTFIEYYGYDMQMAIYALVEAIAHGREDILWPFIAAVTKPTNSDPYPDKAIISFARQDLYDAMSLVEQILPRIAEVKWGGAEPIRCERCDFCKSTKKLTSTVYFRELTLSE